MLFDLIPRKVVYSTRGGETLEHSNEMSYLKLIHKSQEYFSKIIFF